MTEAYYAKNKHGYMLYRDRRFAEYIFGQIENMTGDALRSCDTAVELGAGMGRFSYALPPRFRRVHLIEPSRDYAALLKEQFTGPDIEVYALTANEYFQMHKAEGKAVCAGFHILHHLVPAQRKEIFDRIRGNGWKAVFVEPNPWNPLFLLQLLVTPDMSFKEEWRYLTLTRRRLRREMRASGISLRGYKRICFLPPVIADRLLRWPASLPLMHFLDKLNALLPCFGSYQMVYGE